MTGSNFSLESMIHPVFPLLQGSAKSREMFVSALAVGGRGADEVGAVIGRP
jgi:hypothetical protein